MEAAILAIPQVTMGGIHLEGKKVRFPSLAGQTLKADAELSNGEDYDTEKRRVCAHKRSWVAREIDKGLPACSERMMSKDVDANMMLLSAAFERERWLEQKKGERG